ncbi:restriction endonuclease subunit S [Lactobacillus panisapium]|uniref:restriction endonuclease subunit S n=1 Tax=Lactobacillus panisapium TaxID=2012495 RepID=UPI000CDB4D0C|nr:restriction endonuclease subunit S [Lactobacillus panisapium]
MTEKRLLPHIRFSGFSDNWEKEKIVSIIEIYSGLTYKPEDIQKFGTLVLRSSNVKDGKIINCNNVYVSPSVVNSKNVQKNDIVLVVRNGSKNLIGKHALINADMKNTVIGAFMSGLRSKNGLFVNALLDTVTFKREVFKSMGATINQITNKDLRSMAFLIPKTCEQQKIGSLFAKLDRLLDLQQQKLDQLELLKKALLQKLFPKQGTEIPELRFKGFEDEWKTNALQEISKIVGGGTPDTNKADYWNGDINWYSPTEIGKKPFAYSSNKKISKIGLKKSSAKLLPANKTVLFTSRAGIGDMAILKTPAATNQGFQSLELKDNVCPYFVYSYGFEIKRKAKKLASGSTFLEISNKDMKRITLEFPNVKEQQKIGNLFAKVDRLIELENKKFSNLKQVKKSLLQNMFVE